MNLIRLVGFFALSAALLRPVRFRLWGLEVSSRAGRTISNAVPIPARLAAPML